MVYGDHVPDSNASSPDHSGTRGSGRDRRAPWTVVQSEHLADGPARWLADQCRLIDCPHDDPNFADALAGADGLVVRTYTIVDDALLDRAPNLRVVGRAGVALENIDVPACRERGVEVVHAPGSNTQAVVEYVFCLLADARRPRVTVDQPLDAATWNRWRADVFADRQFNEMTLGIVGLGRIGRRVAEVAGAIGMPVRYFDIDPELREGPPPSCPDAAFADAETLFAECDVISVHIDSRPGNRGFVSRSLIERMKPDALLINTSRGFVVDADALAAYLNENPDARAMIDVHEPEPIDAANPLLGLPNATLLPHLAGRTKTALDNMSWVVRDVVAVLNNEPPQHPAPET